MNKVLVDLALKAGKAIITIISTQIVNYLSSEEFTIRVKSFIQDMVNQLVKLVMLERKKSG